MNMYKNKLVGFGLIAASLALIGLCAVSGSVVAPYLGKAIWYLPYAALVAGVARLAHA